MTFVLILVACYVLWRLVVAVVGAGLRDALNAATVTRGAE